MRMMLILFGTSACVYFVTGIKGRFTRRKRVYFAIGAFGVAYLVTMILTFFEGGL